MNPSNDESRLLSGPDEPVALGINPETLATLQTLQAQYGNVVAVEKPDGRQALFINDADDVRRLLVRHHGRYRKGPGFERVKMLLGNGLIVSDGDVWRRARRMIQPAFTRQQAHRLVNLMHECTTSRIATWEQIALSGESLDITQEMSDFALELILRSIFGGDYERYILKSGENSFAFLSKESERDLRIVLQVRKSRELIMNIVTQRRQRSVQGEFDFLSMYLAATDKSGECFTDGELLDELITLIVAGYETSAGTLNWAWYLLAKHAEVDAALLAESKRLLSDPTEANSDSLTEMAYAQQLLEETLRLYPPVWLFTRRAAEDDEISGYSIREGTDIYLSPFVLHRTKQYWPNPDQFNPDRFGPGSAYKKGERPYFPFSLGPRRCLGEYFSFLEMKMHLGLLIQKFRMTLAAHEEPELDLGINLRTQNSIFLRPELRDRT